VAKKLGDGPNICRAGDIGIGKSSGGSAFDATPLSKEDARF
jgi:hypothetical protein